MDVHGSGFRCVLDLAVEPCDARIALVEMDSVEDLDSAVRIYEVSPTRAQDAYKIS